MRGAWIEIAIATLQDLGFKSLPVRGAWIEIAFGFKSEKADHTSLPVRGAWIEMAGMRSMTRAQVGRSPCGERGLKYVRQHPDTVADRVAPRAGSVD